MAKRGLRTIKRSDQRSSQEIAKGCGLTERTRIWRVARLERVEVFSNIDTRNPLDGLTREEWVLRAVRLSGGYNGCRGAARCDRVGCFRRLRNAQGNQLHESLTDGHDLTSDCAADATGLTALAAASREGPPGWNEFAFGFGLKTNALAAGFSFAAAIDGDCEA